MNYSNFIGFYLFFGLFLGIIFTVKNGYKICTHTIIGCFIVAPIAPILWSWGCIKLIWKSTIE